MELRIILVTISMGAIFWGIRWVWKALNWIYFRPRKLEKLLRKQGFSGNSYKLPLGDMMDSIKMKDEANSKPMEFSHDILSRVDPFLHHTIQIHGKNSFIWFGPTPMVIISEPELMREVLSKVNEYPKPNFSLTELLIPGIASYNGEKWVKHRKLINPAFHMEKLKLMMPSFYVSCNAMMNKWQQMTSKTSSVELDLWPQLVNMTSDVISRAAFSSSYIEGRQAFELIEEQTQTVFKSIKQSIIPGWRYVPTKANRRFNKIQTEIRNLIRGIIDKRRAEMEAGGEMKEDLLGTMMEYSFREMQHGMTIDEMIDECKLFYFAGQETTSVLLSFTMVLLGRYTEWQTRAREEIFEKFDKSIPPDFNGINHLKIVNMILHEVLRLYPPVHSVWRKTEGDKILGKWSLPDGVYLNVPVICSHHDTQQWGDDVKEFKPERFSQGISKAAKENFAFFPFGLGPRVCVGQNLALLEAKIALAMILQRFSFELSPSYAHAPSQVITIRPQFGVPIILHPL